MPAVDQYLGAVEVASRTMSPGTPPRFMGLIDAAVAWRSLRRFRWPEPSHCQVGCQAHDLHAALVSSLKCDAPLARSGVTMRSESHLLARRLSKVIIIVDNARSRCGAMIPAENDKSIELVDYVSCLLALCAEKGCWSH